MTEENIPTTPPKEEKTTTIEKKEPSPVFLNVAIIIFFAVMTIVYNKGTADPLEEAPGIAEIAHAHAPAAGEENWVTPHISKQAKIHILYGDETGGAHFHTVTAPCKAIFPKSWDEDKIINLTEEIAADDSLEWHTFKNGNKYAQKMHEGLLVQVVMDTERAQVKTSYPLNGERTYCPKDEKEEESEESKDQIEIKHKYEYNH